MYRLSFFFILVLFSIMAQDAAFCVDAKAINLMRQVTSATQKVQSLTAVLTVRMQTGNEKVEIKSGRLFLQKPNRAHVELPLAIHGLYATVNSDGKQIWERTIANSRPDGTSDNIYRSVTADAHGKNIQFYFALPVAFFFDPATPLTTMFAVDKMGDLHYVGQEKLNGVMYDVVEQVVLQPTPYTVRLYISPDKRVSRVETDMPASLDMAHHQYFEADLSQVILNRPIPLQAFAFTPTGQIASSVSTTSQSSLPSVGTLAPVLTLRTLNGKALTLQEMLRGKKAVYLDFWFCDCMVCRHEFPALQKLYISLEEQGLAVYAVDALDSNAKVIRYKSQMDLIKSTTFPVVLVGHSNQNKVLKEYGVDAYPSGVLIGADGKVLFTCIGYDDKSGLGDLKAALIRAGLRP